jgi:hypothetical protein
MPTLMHCVPVSNFAGTTMGIISQIREIELRRTGIAAFSGGGGIESSRLR